MTDPKQLPVYLHRQQIIEALSDNQIIIVESPTGSGKTTQIPLILQEAGFAQQGIIGITQPRRIAAVGVSSYISEQTGKLGFPASYCAYKMRFYDTTTPNTKIKILTDGMLLQELKSDPLLKDYSVIMVDEAHERSLNIDFILGLLKELCFKRPELKVIISSATLNTKSFASYFKDSAGNPAPIISIPTRTYKVETKWYPINAEDSKDYLEELNLSICQIINRILKSGSQESLDTLVFLPGELEIKTCMEAIYSNCDYSKLQLYPLYGRLNKEEQELVFTETKPGKTKIVLATNIAETSLTIDGIRVVVDSGLSRMNFYNQENFTSSLVTRKISKSSAMQRQGRAGRTSDGWCYRLYSKEDFKERKEYTLQEILRTDLSEVVLRMSDLGIYNPDSFPFITKPDRQALMSSIKTLRLINAIDAQNHLTPIGELMVRFPLLPRHSRAMVYAMKEFPDFIMPVIVCISFLSSKTPFVLPLGEEDAARLAHRRFQSQYGDFISYQYIFRTYSEINNEQEKQKFCDNNYLDKQSMDEIIHVAGQLKEITEELGLEVSDLPVKIGQETAHAVVVSLASGLVQYICAKKKGSIYRTLTTDEIYIHPGSAWFTQPPDYLLAGEIVLTSKMYARTVSPIKEEWIREISPGLISMMKSRKPREAKQKSTESGKDKQKKMTLFGKTFDVVEKRTGKKSNEIVVIPIQELNWLCKAFRRSSRRPKNIKATLLLDSKFILFDEKLNDLVEIGLRINPNPISKLDTRIFYEDNLKELAPLLSNLMKTCLMPNDKTSLGFVELAHSGKGWFLHATKSWTQAINNSAYSLLYLKEISNDNCFSDAYNRLVRLLG